MSTGLDVVGDEKRKSGGKKGGIKSSPVIQIIHFISRLG